MLGCKPEHKAGSNSSSEHSSDELVGLRTPGVTRGPWIQRVALAAGLALGPHALCLLGLGSLGGGGYLLHNWCSHSVRDLGIPLKKLSDIPEERTEFSVDRAILAEKLLLSAELRFREVIERKAAESEGEPIKVVFFESGEDKRVSVVFCKNGTLCPCSKPELYDVGHKSSLAGTEEFPGQHQIIEALYFGK